MNDFQTSLAAWETFYLLAGTAAATLIGLLFIAISIHIDVFQRKSSTVITEMPFDTTSIAGGVTCSTMAKTVAGYCALIARSRLA